MHLQLELFMEFIKNGLFKNDYVVVFVLLVCV